MVGEGSLDRVLLDVQAVAAYANGSMEAPVSISKPGANLGTAALSKVRFEVASTEPKGSPDLEMREPSGTGEVVDGRHGQPQQLRDFVGSQQLAIERDDRGAHNRLRIVAAPVDGSGASSTIASAPTARAARCTASAIGGAAW